MSLSKRKLAYIRQHAGHKPAEDIARELKLPLAEVQAVVDKITDGVPDRNTFSLAPLIFGVLLLMVFLAPFPVFHRLYDSASLPKSVLIQIGTLLVTTLWLIEGIRTRTLTLTKSSFYLPLGLFLIWALSSLLWAVERYEGFTQWVMWATCALIFFVSTQLLKNKVRIQLLFAAVMLAGVFISLLGILQYHFEVDWVKQRVSPAATFNNKNMAAQVAVLSIPAAIALYLTVKRSSLIWLSALSLTLLYSFVFYTGTKAAWLACIAQLSLLAAAFLFFRLTGKLRFNARSIRTKAGIAALLTILVMFNLTPEGKSGRLEQVLNYISATTDNQQIEQPASEADDMEIESEEDAPTNTAKIRLTTWRNTLEIIKEHPLIGVGLSNFGIYYPAATLKGVRDETINLFRLFEAVHNDYLQIISELGIPALLLVIWALSLILISLWRLIVVRDNIPHGLKYLSLAPLLAVAGLGVNACFSFPLYLPVPPFYLAVYISALVAMTHLAFNKPDQEKLTLRNPALISCLTVFSIALLTTWSITQYRWVLADRYFNIQRSYLEKDWEKVIQWGKRVQSYNPYRKDALKYLARAYLYSGKLDEAKIILQEVTHSFPNATGYLYFQALCHFRLKEYKEAESPLRYAIEILPEEARLRNLMGRLASALGNKEESLKHYRLAVKYAPQNSQYSYNYGAEAYTQEHYQEAAEAFLNAVQHGRKNALAHEWLGWTLFKHLNQKEEGVFYLKKALEIKPDIKNAANIRKTIAQYEKASG